MFNLAIKELIRRRLYILNILTIGLLTVMVIVMTSLGSAYKAVTRLPFEDVQGTIVVQKNGNVPEEVKGVLLSCSLAPIAQSSVSSINGIEGVKGISSALSLWVFDEDHFKRVLGVDWSDSFGEKLKNKLIEGTLPSSDKEVLVEKTYAEQNSLRVGSTEVISGNSFMVTGIMRTSGNEIVASDVYMGLKSAQVMAYESKNLQRVETFNPTDINVVFVDTPLESTAAVGEQIKTALLNETAVGQTPLGQTIGTYNIYTPQSFETQISSFFRISDRLTQIISFIISTGAALLVALSVLHILGERKKEFGIMKSVGFRRRDMELEILSESLLQTLAGFLSGLAISGIAIAILARTSIYISIPWELSPYPHFLLSDPNMASVVQAHLLPVKLEPLYIAITFAVSLTIGLVVSLLSVWYVIKLKPMEILKYE